MLIFQNLFLDQETAVMHRLQDSILEYAEIFHKIIQLSAELDWYVKLNLHGVIF